MRNFRNRENQLMWEAFQGNKTQSLNQPYDQDEWDTDWEDGLTDDEDESIDITNNTSDPLAVIELDTGSELETSEGCNEVIYSDVKKLAEYSQRILDICKETELEPWMQAKLVKASDYVSDIWHRLDAEADFANTGFEQSDNISL